MNAKMVSVAAIAMMMLAGVAGATPIADSVADFSGVQGQDGWYYGCYTGFFATSTFAQYANYNDGSVWGNSWHNTSAGLNNGFVTASEMYPGMSGVSSVRRWVSDFAGEVTISGVMQKEYNGSTADWNNGSIARIYVNGSNCILDQNLMGGTNNNLYTYSKTITVNKGTIVDFVVDAYWNNGCDRTTFTATIVPEPATMALLAVGGVAMIRRRLA